MSDSFKDGQTFVRGLKADTDRMAASNAARQQQIDAKLAQFDARPRKVGMANDLSDPKNLGIIQQWQDPKGNSVYVKNIRGRVYTPEQVQALAQNVEVQRAAINNLSAEQQQVLRTKFQNGDPDTMKHYGDFFRSETLGVKFTQLKTKTP